MSDSTLDVAISDESYTCFLAPGYVASPQAEEAHRLPPAASESKPESKPEPEPATAESPAAAQTDIDPDYQELNEEDGETKETTGDNKEEEELASPMSGRDSDQFASYEVPETGLQVEIQTALLSSPMRGANAGASSDTTE